MSGADADSLFDNSGNDPLGPPPEPSAREPGRKGWQRHYTLVPREWEAQLSKAKRVSTFRLALELLYQHWHNGGKTIVISSKITRAARLSARSKSNALAELQRLGLIDVDRRAGRAPRVIMLHVPIW